MKRFIIISLFLSLLSIVVLSCGTESGPGKEAPPFEYCDPTHLDLCDTIESCFSAGGYWKEDSCNYFLGSWKIKGFKLIGKRYSESLPDEAWTVTLTNTGSYTGNDGKTYYRMDRLNYENQNEVETLTFAEDFYEQQENLSRAYSYKIDENTNEITRTLNEGYQTVTITVGSFRALKITNWVTDYIPGTEPKDHVFSDTQTWSNWFHPAWLLIKEVDYWVDIPAPVIEEVVSIEVPLDNE